MNNFRNPKSGSLDDHETARYLASYIFQQLGTLFYPPWNTEVLNCGTEECLSAVIKEFYDKLP